MMTFREELEAIREHYVRFYLKLLREFQIEEKKFGSELQVRIDSRATHDFYRNYARIDLVEVDSLQSSEVHCKSVKPSQRMFTPVSGLGVELLDCAWYGIDFQCGDFRQDDDAFHDWFCKWYDSSDEGNAVEDGLSGLIHCATTIKELDTLRVFSVDFGSAPVESLLELLTVFQAQGIDKISMGTFLPQDRWSWLG